MKEKLARAQGCLLGQLAGDSLGSLVEFQMPAEIMERYPNGVSELSDGGVWQTIAGQPTDDSELALLLARLLVDEGQYNPASAFQQYQYWLNTKPFDCGLTIQAALTGRAISHSQSNGALMRISPLGVFGANYPLGMVEQWAKQDAALTHPHIICQQVNALFTIGIAYAIATGCDNKKLHQTIWQWAVDKYVEPELLNCIVMSAEVPPEDFCTQQGWVLTAFQNALYQLLHAPNLAEGIIDTVHRGGDTDTNAAICGALLGAVYGREAIPEQWLSAILSCRTTKDDPRVKHPRPECFWPVDALSLAEKLLQKP